MKQRIIRSVSDLGATIRDSRRQQGLTQAELAQKAGVSREWVVGVEQGNRPRAELSRLLAVLHALDEPMSVGAPPRQEPENPSQRASMQGLHLVTEEATRKALAGIRASAVKGVDPEVLRRVANMASGLSPSSDVMRRALRSMGARTPDSKGDR